MSEAKITICRNCGNVSNEVINMIRSNNENICDLCKGEAVSIDLTDIQADKKYYKIIAEKYKTRKHYGVVGADNSKYNYYIKELIREEYYYGKIDELMNDSFTNTRKKIENELLNNVSNELKNTIIDNKNSHIPKCPSCGSTNLSKITATRKILKVGLFGRLGTGDLGKTYKCGDCGVKF